MRTAAIQNRLDKYCGSIGSFTSAAVSLANANPPPNSARVLQFQATVLSYERFVEAATAFATELACTLRCDRVSVGLVERGYAQVVAISHGADFDAQRKLLVAIAAAMDEAIEQGMSLVYPAPSQAMPCITLAHAELIRANGGSACTVPMVSRGRQIGAITLERGEKGGEKGVEAPFDIEEVALCEHIACLVGPVLELKRDNARSWRERVVAGLRGTLARLVGPGHAGTKLAVYGTVAALAAAMLVPVPYRIGAPARIEGSVQRALAAPTDGFVQQVHARPGDTVKAGQVLVELAEQDLQIERRKWESELAQHENAYGAALAHADRAQLVINQAKAAEARAQLALLEQQLARSRVQAPFDGIVIKGDLTQSLGAPVQRGDTLLTLAPNNQFRLIVEVDERDIADIRSGQTGRLALAAMPGDALGLSVERITPVATTSEGRHFFEVEAKLDITAVPLRPGLQGVAKIDAGSRSTAWIWTHRLVDWLRLTVWSLGA